MGLIDFVMNAGQKLFGESEKEAAARGTTLSDFVNKMGLGVEDLAITVSEETATVRGTASSQAVREKVVLAVGNTEGIAKVDDLMSVVAPEPEATYYTVIRGDTLSKIAKEAYGDAMKYPVIFEANKPMLEDPDKIYPGQVLRIPPQ